MTRASAVALAITLAVPTFAADEPALYPFPSPERTVGYIDAGGKVVIPARFERYGEMKFSDGLALVREPGGRQGFIDPTGRFVIGPEFSLAQPFSEGLAFVDAHTPDGVMDGSAFIDPTGRRVIHFPYPGEGQSGVRYGGRFSEGLAPVAWARDYQDAEGVGKQEVTWGYVDKTGKVVIPARFSGAHEFSEGLASVTLGDMLKHEKVECGYVDHDGKLVADGFADCGPFHGGRAAVMRWTKPTDPKALAERRYGYLDTTGALVIPLEYAMAEPFSGGLACVVDASGKAGFIDQKGAYVLKPIYRVCRSFSEGLALVVLGHKGGYIDRSGKQVIPSRFDYAEPFANGLAMVVEGTTVSFIDKTGRAVWSGPAPH